MSRVLTEKQSTVLEVLESGGEWTTAEVVTEVGEVPCDWCDATGVGVTSQHTCRRCVGDGCGDGWRWMDPIEVVVTLGDLRDMELADFRWKRDELNEQGEEIFCISAWFSTPQPDPDDPLEKLWALEA